MTIRLPSSLDRGLALALLVSLLLHGVVLTLRLVLAPATERAPPLELEVALVNARSISAPSTAATLAQASLDGGGNTDQGRARLLAPPPALPAPLAAQGADARRTPTQASAASRPVERGRTALSAPVESLPHGPPAPPLERSGVEPPLPPSPPALSGRDLAARVLLAARDDARMARELQTYESAPRRSFVGAQAREARFALYLDQWREKIERVGNTNYPADARGRIYGSLRLTVAIRADGSIESLEFDRRSGRAQLDQAAERIVRMAAPFAPFPPEVRRDTDVLVITRTWFFEPGDTLRGE